MYEVQREIVHPMTNSAPWVNNFAIVKKQVTDAVITHARFTFQVPHPGLLISLCIASNGVRYPRHFLGVLLYKRAKS